jgi:RNA polymerase sigma factor (TIGR02999 family)
MPEDAVADDATARHVTTLLGQARSDTESEEKLFRVIEDRFRRIARAQMHRERAGHTLQETVLVDDAFRQLVHQANGAWQNREQFFCCAAREMRRRLVDYARGKQAAKRGGGERAACLDQVAEPAGPTSDDPQRLVELNDVLEKLENKHPDVFKVFDLHYFGGWELKEIAAEILDVSYTTNKRRWDMAKAFLHRELFCEDASDEQR